MGLGKDLGAQYAAASPSWAAAQQRSHPAMSPGTPGPTMGRSQVSPAPAGPASARALRAASPSFFLRPVLFPSARGAGATAGVRRPGPFPRRPLAPACWGASRADRARPGAWAPRTHALAAASPRPGTGSGSQAPPAREPRGRRAG
jgi:hypothetical protein